MGIETNISWTDHTFNPWIGCTKVSPGCKHCYAEVDHFPRVQRSRGIELWNPHGKRHTTSTTYWKQPIKWNRTAGEEGVRRRVFCASLADVFEDRVDLIEPLARLLKIIHLTPCLDWQLLTKRPEHVARRLHLVKSMAPTGDRDINDGAELASQWLHGSPMPNLWLGTSVEDNLRAEQRIPHLFRIPATMRFLSVEPLLERVDLSPFLCGTVSSQHDLATEDAKCVWAGSAWEGEKPIDWVIVGGESGHMARPCHVEWIRKVAADCTAAGIPCFVKQLGSNIVGANGEPMTLMDAKGGNPSEWPEDLRRQESPVVEH